MKTYKNLEELLDELLSDSKLFNNNTHQRESVFLEFKESKSKLPHDFWETYSAFSNSNGGYIVLGVSEKPKLISVVGVENIEQQKKDLFNMANNKQKVSYCNVFDENIIECEIDEKIVIAIYIPELSINQKPLYLNGNPLNAYVRGNDGDYKITEEDLRRFMRNAQDETDGELLNDYTMEDLALESVLAFKNVVHTRRPTRNYLEMDNMKFLTEVGVFQIDRKDNRKPKLTLGGLLFLGKQNAILQKLPHFYLDYINRRGRKEARWSDRVSTGDLNYPQLNLFEFYKIAKGKLFLTVQDEFELDTHSVRKSPTELDIALREALANLIIHADYLDPETSIKIEVNDLYYTFINPGTMKISAAQFFTGGKSMPRNHTLFACFRHMGEAEHAGTGGIEILKVIKKNAYKSPELIIDNKYTMLKLWVAAPLHEYPELSSEAQKIYEFISKNNKRVGITGIMKYTGFTKYRVSKELKILLEKDIVVSTGKGRATLYYRKPSLVEQLDAVDKFRNLVINNM